MAESFKYGLQIAQEGVPLRRAADYQKQMDSRWPYLDIFFDDQVRFTKDSYRTTASHFWVMEILTHDLGYIPAFTYREITPTVNGTLEINNLTIVATHNKIYLRGLYFSGDPVVPIIGNIQLRIYAVDVTNSFQQVVDSITPANRTRSSKYGLRALKPGKGNLGIKDKEMSNFSMNTDSKALAIHQTGVLDLNPWVFLNQAKATAIDTGTDILTVAPNVAGQDISWIFNTGQAVTYTPNDFSTYPNPLSGSTYYLIPLTATTVKLANSFKNAQNGVAIDLTSAGSLPGLLAPTDNPAVITDTITHNVGYPPIYMMAELETPDRWSFYTAFENPLVEDCVHALGVGFVGFVTATTSTLKFRGAQAVEAGKFAYLILKDPLENTA